MHWSKQVGPAAEICQSSSRSHTSNQRRATPSGHIQIWQMKLWPCHTSVHTAQSAQGPVSSGMLETWMRRVQSYRVATLLCRSGNMPSANLPHALSTSHMSHLLNIHPKLFSRLQGSSCDDQDYLVTRCLRLQSPCCERAYPWSRQYPAGDEKASCTR